MLKFINTLKFSFANFPINSKYYHTQLPVKIADILTLITKQNKLNQKCFLLQHLSDILLEDSKLILTYEQKNLINSQLLLWKNGSGRFQNIATVAWVIKKLNIRKKHVQLYQEIAERVRNDQWYVNFDESVKALQAFADLPDSSDKIKTLKKIQRNLGITTWNVNMKYYQRITLSLLQAGRFDSPLWQKIQNQILQNLGMNYDIRTVCDIFKAYAISKNGHDVFYQMMEKVLFQGHFQQRKFRLGNNFQNTGQFFSLIVQTYSLANQSKALILTPDFLDFIFKNLIQQKVVYRQLSSITKTLKHLKGLQFDTEQIRQIQQVLLDKKPSQISIKQIKQFYQFCLEQYGEIPKKLHAHVEQLLIKDINSKFIPSSELVDLVKYLTQRKCIYNEQKMFQIVNSYLQANFKYLYSEQAKYVIQQTKQIKKLQVVAEGGSRFKLLPNVQKEVL